MKNKLFLCYRPLVIETESESKSTDSFDDRLFPEIAVVKSPPSDKETLKRSKSERSSRSVSGIFKAALFEISLKKKARKRKISQLKLGSESDESKNRDSFSSFSSSYSSSLPSPTPKSLSDSELEWKTEPISPKQRSQSMNREVDSSGSKLGFLLITVVLFLTVFYGRLLAVMFTCLCLYSLPRRNIGQGKTFISEKSSSPETEPLTGKYRKRVIMEGMLERNYQRCSH